MFSFTHIVFILYVVRRVYLLDVITSTYAKNNDKCFFRYFVCHTTKQIWYYVSCAIGKYAAKSRKYHLIFVFNAMHFLIFTLEFCNIVQGVQQKEAKRIFYITLTNPYVSL